MKNKKLKLGELKVQSFVTSLNQREKNTIKGGVESINEPCQLTANPAVCHGSGGVDCASGNFRCNDKAGTAPSCGGCASDACPTLEQSACQTICGGPFC